MVLLLLSLLFCFFYKGIKVFVITPGIVGLLCIFNVNKVHVPSLCGFDYCHGNSSHHLILIIQALVQMSPPLGPTSPDIFSWNKGTQPLHCHGGHLE